MSITTEEKIGYLVLNTGTPDAPTIPALRSYLKEFCLTLTCLTILTRLDHLAKGFDKIKNYISVVLRWIVLNLIVLPFEFQNQR